MDRFKGARSSWQKKFAIQTMVTRVLNTIVLDINHSKFIVEATDSTFILIKDSGNFVKYHFDGRSLTRNNETVTSEADAIVAALITEVKHGSQHQIGTSVHVKILGKSKAYEYSLQTDASIPQSSKSQFLISSMND